jgi:hypothetical protein
LVGSIEFRELYIPSGWSLKIRGHIPLPVVVGEFGIWFFQ